MEEALGNYPEAALLALASASHSTVFLHFKLADRCNHACQHCYQVQGLKGELTRDQVEELLREFRAGGGFVVTFSGGEATLREDLIPLLTYANELGLATVLYTNGFTMTEALASELAACHVWRVEISLYSHQAAEHDALTRTPGSWAKTTQGVRWLRARQVNVLLKFTPTALSSSSSEQVAALARELDAHLFVAELLNAGEAGRTEPTGVRRSAEGALASFTSPASQFPESLEGKPCSAGEHLSVRSDGQLQPCAYIVGVALRLLRPKWVTCLLPTGRRASLRSRAMGSSRGKLRSLPWQARRKIGTLGSARIGSTRTGSCSQWKCSTLTAIVYSRTATRGFGHRARLWNYRHAASTPPVENAV